MTVRTLVAKPALKLSTKALLVGLPGREKSSVTPFSYAHRSSAFEMNSGPLSTRMLFGAPRTDTMRVAFSVVTSLSGALSLALKRYRSSIEPVESASCSVRRRRRRATAGSDSGTRCGSFIFMRCAGIDHAAPLR